MLRIPKPSVYAWRRRVRWYNDDATFGHRVPARYTLPDLSCKGWDSPRGEARELLSPLSLNIGQNSKHADRFDTQTELDNRNTNASLLRYVENVRRHGHRAAKIDPLDLMDRDPVGALSAERYGLSSTTSYPLQGILHLSSPSFDETNTPRTEIGEGSNRSASLDEISGHLMKTYVGHIGYEYMHCPDKNERLWFSHHVETGTSSFERPFSDERRRRIWRLLSRSEELDHFLAKKFPNLKRYGCEGAESMLPALDTLFELGAGAGITSIIVSLPHRGRLSLLCNPDLLRYPPSALFAKIKGQPEFDPSTAPGATGDVISHLAAIRKIDYSGRLVKVEVLQNPSHLEAVNPVALGVTRAKQMSLLKSSPRDCRLGDRVMCVQLHGDAAFAGQGVVAESLGLSGLPHYGSGGTVHVIVNNNIGYTTPASFARSSVYSSDIGKMIGCPILHVNGDYPEAVVQAMDVAFQYRQMFRKDIIVDLICYRRWGHNELDEPAYTQPRMYEKIRNRKSVPELYEDQIIAGGFLDKAEATESRKTCSVELARHLELVDDYRPKSEMLDGKWKGFVWPALDGVEHDPLTGVDKEVLEEVGRKSVTLPEGFNVHPRLLRHISSRLKSLEHGDKVDFATAEAMAFGTLMEEGYDVRISGQDVGRGTFSQRHAMFVDQVTEQCSVPLNENIDAGKGRLELANSSLSEMAVLGFEVGMSWARPNLLPIWEAQFGDFMNGAQSMIDTFVIGAQAKWLKQSGLVMMLPHGYDGAGPEHSSCKIERFLQMSDDSPTTGQAVNVGVVNPSTPAQMFHVLRRQMKRPYRRPLIFVSPKALLRSPIAASSLSDMSSNTSFLPLIDPSTNSSDATRLILCSGKHAYTLSEALSSHPGPVAIVRIEELSPFPRKELAEAIRKYAKATVVWAQEEPENQGAWTYVRPRIEDVLEEVRGVRERVRYAGRKPCATTATGVGEWHKREMKEILSVALE